MTLTAIDVVSIIMWHQQTNDKPTGRSNISIPPSDSASDAHDIAAASATIQ